MSPTLPLPRGELSSSLAAALQGAHPAGFVEPSSHEDEALSLWMLYELHHRGFDNVDDGLEWDPALLSIRSRLEYDLEARWREQTRWITDLFDDAAGFEAAFFALCEQDTGGPSIASFIQKQADSGQVLEILKQRSIYHVREQDAAMWTLPRLDNATKAHLMTIAFDEYGDGDVDCLHAELWRRGMNACGLDTGYGAYVDEALPEVLEQNNLMSMLGLHKRLVPAALGHLAAFEVTSSVPSRRVARGLERLGFPEQLIEYYREHMVADAIHEQVAVRMMLGGLVRREPDVTSDVVFGAAVCLLAEQATACAVLDHVAALSQKGAA